MSEFEKRLPENKRVVLPYLLTIEGEIANTDGAIERATKQGWLEFANMLKIKILMRLRNVNENPDNTIGWIISFLEDEIKELEKC